jgi:hypothetical protein
MVIANRTSAGQLLVVLEICRESLIHLIPDLILVRVAFSVAAAHPVIPIFVDAAVVIDLIADAIDERLAARTHKAQYGQENYPSRILC